MTHRSALILALASLAFLSLGVCLYAQSGGTQSGQPSANQMGPVSPPIQVLVTGCLKRGNDGGYYLSDENGRTWQLSSQTVDLATHVNHSVTVTGKPGTTSKPQAGAAQQGETTQTGGKPSPSLRVLTLKVLSPSCTR